MIYLIALLTGTAITLAIVALAELVPAPPRRAVTRELGRLQQRRRRERDGTPPRREQVTRERLVVLLLRLGAAQRWQGRSSDAVRQLLVHAGYRGPDAVTVFWGVRLALTGGLVAGSVLLGGIAGLGAVPTLLAGCWAAAFGWCSPSVYLRGRIRRRKQELLRFLPDALDLLVICVEAGLGLNQAIARVAEEIRPFSRTAAGEFAQVHLEIRAGSPREEALRGLGTRTDVPEMKALASVLVQTDRFGTSVTQALRVHSDGLRTRWQQRMEEASAKTTIKLVFPLVLCILPVLFVIILAPLIIRMLRSFAAM